MKKYPHNIVIGAAVGVVVITVILVIILLKKKKSDNFKLKDDEPEDDGSFEATIGDGVNEKHSDLKISLNNTFNDVSNNPVIVKKWTVNFGNFEDGVFTAPSDGFYTFNINMTATRDWSAALYKYETDSGKLSSTSCDANVFCCNPFYMYLDINDNMNDINAKINKGNL